ncbi:DUF7620 family protein [Streptomonospora wellingtoniae]
MRWLGWCRHRAPDPPVSEEEARAARVRAEGDMAAAVGRDPVVRDVVRRLAAQREQNHFGPVIWRALRGESDG